MSSGPPASRLVLLSDLPHCSPGEKVRFLGCVDEYIVQAATLRLKHDYPQSSPQRIANVNIKIVLESIKRIEVEVGSWINVIGYVERREENGNEQGIFVQAVAVWDAGSLDLAAYQRAIDARKEAD